MHEGLAESHKTFCLGQGCLEFRRAGAGTVASRLAGSSSCAMLISFGGLSAMMILDIRFPSDMLPRLAR